MKNKKVMLYAFILVYLIFSILGIILLPDTVVIQVNFSGAASNSIQKFIFLPILLILEVGLTYYLYKSQKKNDEPRSVISFIIFFVVNILLFIFNL